MPPGSPQGGNVVVVTLVVVTLVDVTLVEEVDGAGSLSAGRQSSTGFITSMTSGRIWLFVETVVIGKETPTGSFTR
jgi:hypothetical protein